MSFSVSLATITSRIRRKLAEGRPPRARSFAICGLTPRLGGFARPLLAPAEVGGGRDPAVEVRPARALGERLLDPVEAAEVAAEVVQEVHERGLARAGHDRAAVLELAVVAEDDVQKRVRVVGREAVDLLDRAPHPVVAEWDLAEQLAGVGQLDRAVAAGVGLDLADVVQQR